MRCMFKKMILYQKIPTIMVNENYSYITHGQGDNATFKGRDQCFWEDILNQQESLVNQYSFFKHTINDKLQALLQPIYLIPYKQLCSYVLWLHSPNHFGFRDTIKVYNLLQFLIFIFHHICVEVDSVSVKQRSTRETIYSFARMFELLLPNTVD